MTKRINFGITSDPERRSYGVVLSPDDFYAFRKWWNNGFGENRSFRDPGPTASPTLLFLCEPDHPMLAEALRLLASYGWLPYDGFVPPELTNGYFDLDITCYFDDADLEAADFLSLSTWGAEDSMIWFSRYENERFIGLAKSVGEWIPSAWDDSFGYGGGMRDFFVHSRIREVLERELKGCHFLPVGWADPENAKGEFWQLTTYNIMPACRTKLALDHGSWFYEDGGFRPPTLTFGREAVAAMGEFDVAWTREITGETAEDRPNYRGRTLIISQKFRQLMKSLISREDQRIICFPVRLV